MIDYEAIEVAHGHVRRAAKICRTAFSSAVEPALIKELHETLREAHDIVDYVVADLDDGP